LQVEGVTVELGIDNDDKMLRSWARNTGTRAVCATVGTDEIPWPEAAPDVHVHLSPPCTALSKARAGSATQTEVDNGLGLLRFSLEQVIERGYAQFSIEQVSTQATRALADEFVHTYPTRIAHLTVDSADYGVPQTRVRLIISTPPIVRALKETPVHRVTVADALTAAGLTAPATHVKSNTTNRDGSPCLRSIQQPTFTVTAAHPLQWANHDGKTIRCCTPTEQALLQTFPPTWAMPSGYRLSIHAAGNAIPPTLAAHIMRCAIATSEAAPSPPPPPPLALPPPPLPAVVKPRTSAQLRALQKRVRALEKAVGLS
jgi:site-specific DNA-cytosine methylase